MTLHKHMNFKLFLDFLGVFLLISKTVLHLCMGAVTAGRPPLTFSSGTGCPCKPNESLVFSSEHMPTVRWPIERQRVLRLTMRTVWAKTWVISCLLAKSHTVIMALNTEQVTQLEPQWERKAERSTENKCWQGKINLFNMTLLSEVI